VGTRGVPDSSWLVTVHRSVISPESPATRAHLYCGSSLLDNYLDMKETVAVGIRTRVLWYQRIPWYHGHEPIDVSAQKYGHKKPQYEIAAHRGTRRTTMPRIRRASDTGCKRPRAIPYILDGPAPAVAQLLKALASLIAEMNARLVVLEALYGPQMAGDPLEGDHPRRHRWAPSPTC
jgi:hypothetical protein